MGYLCRALASKQAMWTGGDKARFLEGRQVLVSNSMIEMAVTDGFPQIGYTVNHPAPAHRIRKGSFTASRGWWQHDFRCRRICFAVSAR